MEVASFASGACNLGSKLKEVLPMALVLPGILVAAGLASALDDQPARKEPDKIIEMTVKDGVLIFAERGKGPTQSVTVVVGQVVRWVNRDTEPHTLTSALRPGGKPLLDTGSIKPGEYKDVLFDIDLYRRAGGRTANVVTIKLRQDGRPDAALAIELLSAAKRGPGRP